MKSGSVNGRFNCHPNAVQAEHVLTVIDDLDMEHCDQTLLVAYIFIDRIGGEYPTHIG